MPPRLDGTATLSCPRALPFTSAGTGKWVDAAGIAIVVIGVAAALLRYLPGLILRKDVDSEQTYHTLRMRIGRSILLGLEFLVAGDIIRTVAVAPTFRSLGVLAGIVVIRTFLSFSLEVEISGRWPWQRQTEPAQVSRLPGKPQPDQSSSQERRAA